MRRVVIRPADGFDRVVVARCGDLTHVYTPPEIPWDCVIALLDNSERALLRDVA